MQSVNLGWIFPTNFEVMHLTKSHVKKSYLKVLKIPSGSSFYSSPAHGDTSAWTGEREKALRKLLGPVSNQDKQKSGSEEMCLGEWNQIKAEMKQNILNN